jgi:hypothetical protein
VCKLSKTAFTTGWVVVVVDPASCRDRKKALMTAVKSVFSEV